MAESERQGLASILFVLGVLLSIGITAAVGWRPFIGPKARPLTDRRCEPTPARLERGAYLVRSVTGCLFYNEELFVETLRTGRVREPQISDVMPWGHYRGMSDEDLRAIFAHLKTLKPVGHYVDNALPATPCAKCNLQHGGGERNVER